MVKIIPQINISRVYLLFAVILFGFVPARAQFLVRMFEEKVGPIPEYIITLSAGQTVSFQTVNLSAGIDPVLHLWDLKRGVEVAMDDNSGGGHAAALRARVTRSGDYVLIVRQRDFHSEGTMDILSNGLPWKNNVRVGGRYMFMPGLLPKEQISALPPPLGPSSHFMYLLSPDGEHIELRLRGTPRSRWEVPAATSAARTLLLGVQADDSGKPIRVYRNDFKLAGADPDGDGLGSGLERQLKTCSAVTDSFDAFTCNRVTDLRDTDGDGISDGWEVLGRDYNPEFPLPFFGPIDYVAVPTWGANPRHKDLFIEADYRRLTLEENKANIKEHMPPEVARQIAESYGDKKTTHPLLRLFHAALVANPDQQPGISLHIDTGLAPQKPEDAGIYGDWGGYDAINAVKNKKGEYVGQQPALLWSSHMHPSRRGIFLYGPGHKSGGGQCPVVSMYCGYNFNDASIAIHEMLHALGINHSAPYGAERLGANCKPNYPSAANYAYQKDMLLSNGRDRPSQNNVALKEWNAVPPFNTGYIKELRDRFKYLVDAVNGHVDWNRDGVFAPADQTVRGYANYAPDNNCEFTRLNEVAFTGTKATSVALARVGRHTLLFYLDQAGKVRYRRSTSSWNCPPAEKNCAGSSFGSPASISFPKPIQSLDAEPVNIEGAYQVSIVAIDRDGKLYERRLALQSNGTLVLSSTINEIPQSVAAAGELSLAETRDGTGIYLVYKGYDNVVRWRFRNTADWGAENITQFSSGVNIVTSAEASPGIAGAYPPLNPSGPAALYLAYSDAFGMLRLVSLNSKGLWEDSKLQTDFPFKTQGRPAMAWVPNITGMDSPGQFYMVVRDQDNRYKMMRTYFNTEAKAIRIGLSSYFDNVSLFGTSIDLIASGSTGHPQLWAVLIFDKKDANNKPAPQILFRPRADGISDVKQRNYDDWTAVGSSLCNVVVNPDRTEAEPIRCSKRTW